MFLKSIFKRNQKKSHEKSKSKFDLNNWMDLSKEERLEIDSKEKNETMIKKKKLLRSIRDEYIKIQKKNS
tara:strand:+ start:272 stop:481 length:210 start_codon:yes stop_codon:yes gene_type:complete